jgi:S1-C subfamily serine protease
MSPSNRTRFVTACAATGLLLAAASLRAQPIADPEMEGDGDARKIERRVVVLADGADGKPQIWESDGGNVKRGYLGVGLTDLTPELRSHFGVPENAGVLISRVEPGSPAEKAGIKVGDILTSVAGAPVESSLTVRAKVRDAAGGAPLAIELRRDGRTQQANATIELREHTEIDMGPLFLKERSGDKTWLKMDPKSLALAPGRRVELRTLNPEQRDQLEKKLKALEKRISELESKLNQH